MRIRIFAAALALFLCATMTVYVSAAGNLPRLVDNADLLTDAEEEELLNTLNEISERQQVDIVVVTESSIGGASARDYADDFFDYNGYGIGEDRDGILLLISMEERDWYISTSGYGITAVTDAGLKYMSEQFVGYLSDGEYAVAFTSYAELCDEYITRALSGEAYDVGNLPKEPFGLRNIAIAFAAAFIISLIVTGIMRMNLKSVHSQPAAGAYIKNGSIQVTKRNDLFLYSHVSRSERPKNTSSHSSGGSSTHSSSSGSRHGGGGGKF